MSSSPTEQALEVTMPQMGVSVAEGTIIEWRKRPGDWVEADETVCVVTTDKVDVEIPAPASGRLDRILVEEGATVEVGTALAALDRAARPGEPHREEDGSGAEVANAPATITEPDRSGFYSPVVRRIASKHDVALETILGTGIGGRVRKHDLIAHLEQRTPPGGPERERPLHTESPYRPDQAGEGRREPMSPMRKRIAEHMLESRRTSAHVTTVIEADLGAVVAARAERKEAMAARGVSLTYLAFVAVATVAALQRHPALNCSIEDDEIVYHDEINLGIAVALESGLIVPVIHNAERLSMEGMAAAIGELAARARAGELSPDEVAGGTFTITNPGQFGTVLATPIINQPQVAILDLEAVVKRPVVVEAEGGDSIAIRPMANLCLSFDHRALDGAQAAQFLAEVRDSLQGWKAAA